MAGAAVPTPRFLADVYEAASECNKCSLCQATCPAYVVNPVEWETARGRIALIRDAMEGRLELRDIAEGPLSSCLTCDNCVAACAPRVPTGHIVSRARQELHAQEGYPWGQSFALRSVLPRPGALRALHGFARFTKRTGLYGLAQRIGMLSWLGTLGALAEQSGPPPDKTVYQMLGDLPPVAQPVRGDRSRCWCAASRISPCRRRPTRPSGCCSPPATTCRCPSSAAAVCRRAPSATATRWWTWRSGTARR